MIVGSYSEQANDNVLNLCVCTFVRSCLCVLVYDGKIVQNLVFLNCTQANVYYQSQVEHRLHLYYLLMEYLLDMLSKE